MVGVLVINMRKLSYPPIWLFFEQGCAQVAAGVPFAVGAGGCCGLACGQDPAMSDARPHWRLRLPRPCPRSRPRGFWTVSQEMGADFAIGPGLLGGFRRGSFAVSFSDLGKRRRVVAFRAGSPCETVQKSRAGFACVEGGASWRVFRFRRCWSQALRLPVIKDQVGGSRWSACRSLTWLNALSDVFRFSPGENSRCSRPRISFAKFAPLRK